MCVEILTYEFRVNAPGEFCYLDAHEVIYDGDPDKRGEAFDIELIPFIPAGESYELSVPFSTWGKKRGRHDIFAVVHAKIDEADLTDNVISQRVIVRGRKGR
jgi:hypothetical protein